MLSLPKVMNRKGWMMERRKRESKADRFGSGRLEGQVRKKDLDRQREQTD